MSVIISPPWGRQPPVGCSISPQWKDAGLVAVFQFSARYTRDPLTGLAVPIGPGQSLVYGAAGGYRRFTGTGWDSGSNTIGGLNLNSGIDPTFSVFVKYWTPVANGGTLVSCQAPASGTRVFQLASNIGGTGPSITIGGSYTELNWGYNTAGAKHAITVVNNNGAHVIHGDEDRSQGISNGAAGTATESFCIGSRTNTTGYPLTGNIESVLIFNKAISREQHKQLYRNTNIIYSRRRLLPFLDSSAAGYTHPALSNARMGSITTTGGIPLVDYTF